MEMTIWTAEFWKSAVERAFATLIQSLLGLIVADSFDVLGADWKGFLIAVATATFISLLKGIAANMATKTGPSFLNSEQVVPPLPQPEGREII